MNRSARSISSATRSVALALGARGHELLVPLVDLGQVREAALGERPQQVQRGGRLVVGLHQPVGVGGPRRLVGRDVVDHVAPERRQLTPSIRLGARRAGLGELAGDAPHLDDRHAGRIREHDGHLQDDLELVADGVGREASNDSAQSPACSRNALRATSASSRSGPGLARRTRGAAGRQVLEGVIEGRLVGPGRLLGGQARARSPRHVS